MNLDVTDRRRLLVATAATLIALPAIWLFTRDEATNGNAVPTAAVAGVETPAGAGAATTDSAVDPFGTSGPIFVDGPTTPPKPAVIQIVVPAAPEGEYVDGGATYARVIGQGAADSCSAPNADFGATLTITNRDNGRTITCVNRHPAVLGPGLEVKLTTAQFEPIGQIVDAPIPVRISWDAG